MLVARASELRHSNSYYSAAACSNCLIRSPPYNLLQYRSANATTSCRLLGPIRKPELHGRGSRYPQPLDTFPSFLCIFWFFNGSRCYATDSLPTGVDLTRLQAVCAPRVSLSVPTTMTSTATVKARDRNPRDISLRLCCATPPRPLGPACCRLKRNTRVQPATNNSYRLPRICMAWVILHATIGLVDTLPLGA